MSNSQFADSSSSGQLLQEILLPTRKKISMSSSKSSSNRKVSIDHMFEGESDTQ